MDFLEYLAETLKKTDDEDVAFSNQKHIEIGFDEEATIEEIIGRDSKV